jgi:hypothetical protein
MQIFVVYAVDANSLYPKEAFIDEKMANLRAHNLNAHNWEKDIWYSVQEIELYD